MILEQNAVFQIECGRLPLDNCLPVKFVKCFVVCLKTSDNKSLNKLIVQIDK
jgi:hypothetical protein